MMNAIFAVFRNHFSFYCLPVVSAQGMCQSTVFDAPNLDGAAEGSVRPSVVGESIAHLE